MNSRRNRVLKATLGGSRFVIGSGSVAQTYNLSAEFGDLGNDQGYQPVTPDGTTFTLTSVDASPTVGAADGHTAVVASGKLKFTNGGTNLTAPDGSTWRAYDALGNTFNITITETANLATFNSVAALNAQRNTDAGLDPTQTLEYGLRYSSTNYDMTAASLSGTVFSSTNLATQPTHEVTDAGPDFSFNGGFCTIRGCAGEPYPTCEGSWASGNIGATIYKHLSFCAEDTDGYFYTRPVTYQTITSATDNGDGTTTFTVSGMTHANGAFTGKKINATGFAGDWAVANALTADTAHTVTQDYVSDPGEYTVDFDSSALPTWVQGTHGGSLKGLFSSNTYNLITNNAGGTGPLRFTEVTFGNRGLNPDESAWGNLINTDGGFSWIIVDNCVADGCIYFFRGNNTNRYIYRNVVRNFRHDVVSTFSARPISALWKDLEFYGKVGISSITAAYPPIVTTTAPHSFSPGDSVGITDSNSNFLGANTTGDSTRQTTLQCTRQNSMYFVGPNTTATTFELYEGGQRPLITVDGSTDFDTTGGAGNHKVNSTAHGLTGTKQFLVHEKVGGSLDTALTPSSYYYAVNINADDFQISATQGGAAIDFNGDGSGDIGFTMLEDTARPESRSPVDAAGAVGWTGANAPNNDGYAYGPVVKQSYVIENVFINKPYDVNFQEPHTDLIQGGSTQNVYNQKTYLIGNYAFAATDKGPSTQGFFMNGFENDCTLGEIHCEGNVVMGTDQNQLVSGFWRDYQYTFNYGVIFRANIVGGGGAMTLGGAAAPENTGQNRSLGWLLAGGVPSAGGTVHPGTDGSIVTVSTSTGDIGELFDDDAAISTFARGSGSLTYWTDEWADDILVDTGTWAQCRAFVEARVLPTPSYENYGIYQRPSFVNFPHSWFHFLNVSLSIDDFDNAPATTKLAHGVISYKPVSAAIGVGETIFESDAAQPVIDVALNSSNQIVVEAYGSGGTKDWSVTLTGHALIADEEVLILWDFDTDTGGTGLRVLLLDATDGSTLASGSDSTLGTLAPVSQTSYTLMPDGLGSAITWLSVDMEAGLDTTDTTYISTNLVDANGLRPPAYHLWAQRGLNGADTTPDVFLWGSHMLGHTRKPGTVAEQDEDPPVMPVGKFDNYAADGGAWTKSGTGHVYSERVRDAHVLAAPTTEIYARNSTEVDVDITFAESGRWGTLHYGVTASATPPNATDLKAGTGITGKTDIWLTELRTQATVTGLTASTTYYGYAVQEAPDGTLGSVISLGSVKTPSLTTVWQEVQEANTRLTNASEFFASSNASDTLMFACAIRPDNGTGAQINGLFSVGTTMWLNMTLDNANGFTLELDKEPGGGLDELTFPSLTYTPGHRYLIFGTMDARTTVGTGWKATIIDLDDPTNRDSDTNTSNGYTAEVGSTGETWSFGGGGSSYDDLDGAVAFIFAADALVDHDDLEGYLLETIDGKGWIKATHASLTSNVGAGFISTWGTDFQTGANQATDGTGQTWTVGGSYASITNGDILQEQA